MKLIKDTKLTAPEVLQHLLNGNVVFINDSMYKFSGEQLYYYYGNHWEKSRTLFNDLLQGEKYSTKPQEWYENIPKQGILCKSWDDTDHENVNGLKYFRIISKFHSEQKRKFVDSNGLEWHNAVPVTLDDIKELIYDPNT